MNKEHMCSYEGGTLLLKRIVILRCLSNSLGSRLINGYMGIEARIKSGFEELSHLSVCWYLKLLSDPFSGFQARENILSRGLSRKSYKT